jgi:hypothetical protein
VAATLDDAARARLGVDLGSSLSGAVPIKLTGKISGSEGDNRDNRFGVEADLTAARIDNLLPGWTKVAGRTTKMTFNVVQSLRARASRISWSKATAPRSRDRWKSTTRTISSMRRFRHFRHQGDKANLKAERQPDGMLKVTMRGDVFDGRGFIKSAMSGRDQSAKEKSKSVRHRYRRQAWRAGRLLWRGGAQHRSQAHAPRRSHPVVLA